MISLAMSIKAITPLRSSPGLALVKRSVNLERSQDEWIQAQARLQSLQQGCSVSIGDILRALIGQAAKKGRIS